MGNIDPRTFLMGGVLALALLMPGTAHPVPEPEAPPPAWVEDHTEGGELRFTASTGGTYDVRLELSSVLPDDPDEDGDETTVVLRGGGRDVSAAMVVTENTLRIVANTPEGSHRFDRDGEVDHPDGRGLSDVVWQGRSL